MKAIPVLGFLRSLSENGICFVKAFVELTLLR